KHKISPVDNNLERENSLSNTWVGFLFEVETDDNLEATRATNVTKWCLSNRVTQKEASKRSLEEAILQSPWLFPSGIEDAIQ
ncbi:hypothetical protein LEMLEM_LOCUS6809, partial [Lemmus lemmus]